MLTIQLFGEFQCRDQGQPISALYAPRLRALLAYLLLHRAAPISRQQLAFHFWPESGDAQARTNLRNLLTQFRAALPNAESYLRSDLQTLQWQADAPFTLDVAEFQRLLASAQQSNEAPLARLHLEQGLQLYQADLLPSCYDDWLLPIREELRNAYLQALADLVERLTQQGETRAALAQAQRLRQHDPLRESTYAQLMNLHAALGDRAAALRVYHSCVTTLIRELGVEPATTTRLVYERLLNLEKEELRPAPVPATTTLLGREKAWAQLQAAWQRASRGQPHLVLIRGEAGVGKTRLAEALLEWANRQGMLTLSAHCYSVAGQLALAPILDWLRTDYFRPAIDALDPMQRADLARLMPEVAERTAAHAPLTAGSDSWQRQRLFDLLVRLTLWQDQPRILLIDDLQWCDSETLDWLHYLLHVQARTRLLLVGTVRDEELLPNQPLNLMLHQLRRTETLFELTLDRLDRATTANLAATLSGRPLDEHEAASLFTQTEGNPLFIVETMRAQVNGPHGSANDNHAVEPTVGPMSAHAALPPKVQAVIQSRLLRLSAPARGLIDVAAVIGRSFTLEVLALASEQSEDVLTLGLDELWQNKIVDTQDADAYDFSHDKLREVALVAISPAWRRLLHQRVARALATVHAHNLDGVSGQLAHHCEASNQADEAINYYQRAARVAHRLSALADAISYLQRAIKLLPRLTDPTTSGQLELALQVALAPLLQARRGYSAPEVEATLQRALTLCRASGESPLLFRILWGLGRFYLVLPNFRAGLEIGNEMLTIATAADDLDRLLEAHNTLGAMHFHLGNLPAARYQLEAAVAHYDPVRHREHALLYGQDPGLISLIRLAWTLWLGGETAAAHVRCAAALALVETSNHPFSKAFGFAYAAVFYHFCNDVMTTQHYAGLAKALADAHGFPIFQGMGEQFYGWALVQQDQIAEGLACQVKGWQIFTATGSELGLGIFATLHAEAYARLGRIDEGLAILDQGLTVAAKTHERWQEPAVYYCQGKLLRQRNGAGDAAASAACFAKAVAIAEEIGASGWLANLEESV